VRINEAWQEATTMVHFDSNAEAACLLTGAYTMYSITLNQNTEPVLADVAFTIPQPFAG
jgi:hypothetical protein